MKRFYCKGCGEYINKAGGKVLVDAWIELWKHGQTVDLQDWSPDDVVEGSLVCPLCNGPVEIREGEWVFVQNENT